MAVSFSQDYHTYFPHDRIASLLNTEYALLNLGHPSRPLSEAVLKQNYCHPFVYSAL